MFDLNSGNSDAIGRDAVRRWKLVVRLCQAALAVVVGFAVWSIGFAAGEGPVPVLPDTETQFSLDLSVIGAMDHPVVYVVEQRARPAYRIFAYDPATGTDTTIFTVPEDAIVYGIALNQDRSALAVAYSPDFDLGGNGLWTLDLDSGEMSMVLDVEADVFHTDPVWTADGSAVLTTRVDRSEDTEQLGAASIEIFNGRTQLLMVDAINPVVVGDDVYVLELNEENARRSIGRIDGDEITQIVAGDLDLDHLVAEQGGGLIVAAIDVDDGQFGLTFGSVAGAHGNHDVPSTWWTIPIDSADLDATPQASEVPSIIVYDAAAGDNAIVYATNEGLSIAAPESGNRHDLIKSRAIRFVAG